jgi:hypothetical protein
MHGVEATAKLEEEYHLHGSPEKHTTLRKATYLLRALSRGTAFRLSLVVLCELGV